MSAINDAHNGDEEILWEGRPAIFPFFAGTLLSAAMGLPLLAVVALSFRSESFGNLASTPAGILFFTPFILLGLALGIAYPAYRILTYFCLSYAITSKRVLLRSGIIERTTQMVDFDQIADASVHITFVNILLGFGRTGSVSVTTRTSPSDHDDDEDEDAYQSAYVFSHIPHPYDVFEFLKRAEYDVKADIEYPNMLRPPANPGYGTTYPPPVQP